MLRFISIFTIVFISQYTLAQTVLSGRVSDLEDNPIEGVEVVLDNTKTTITSSKGEYSFEVKKGVHRLETHHISYQTNYIEVDISDMDKRLDIRLENETAIMNEVSITALRLNENSPMSYSKMDKEDLEEQNLGQDMPILLSNMTSVVTTSDAGAGVGYTGMRVRGSDATRVNVVINGVPYNDSESQGTYWVDLPDFASSLESVQLSRGVGSSTNGSGAFGANLNLLTSNSSKSASAEISSSYGSFNTMKNNLRFNTGLMSKYFQISGSLSSIKSDGYIDRASSDLKSYFLQALYKDKKNSLKALMFGGHEKTYQAWDGIDSLTLTKDRQTNFAGFYTDANGNEQYYDNQVDNYNQDHYQLHYNRIASPKFKYGLTGHYTYGRGYYEQYKEDQALADYGINDLLIDTISITQSDIIRRKWLDNHFYGFISSATYKAFRIESTLGVSWNQYRGDHYGEIIWAQYASNSEIRDHYYDDYGDKDEVNAFWKNTYNINDNLFIYTDLQLRNITYKADGIASDVIDDEFSFFNPKFGLSYKMNNSLYYLSYARANREPSRGDYENGNPVPEQLDDIELGWRVKDDKYSFNINGYYMLYKDQLVLTGALDEDGAAIRTNIGKSYRAGIELEAAYKLSAKFDIIPNANISSNKNMDYHIEEEGELIDLGKTNIGYSPNIVVSNSFVYKPIKSLRFNLISKYVGEQYMSNTDDKASLLEDYFINNFLISYSIEPKSSFRSIDLTLLVNNIFNVEYVSNGWWAGQWGAGYYPQAKINVLAGISVKL